MLEHVNSLDILPNFQIGFLPKNRSADNVLTSRTLVDKYVYHHNENIVLVSSTSKTLSTGSIWNHRLLFKVLQINVSGCFSNLRWFPRNKSYRWILLKLSWMFSTKDCFEKYNKNHRSPFSFKRCDGPILPHFMPVMVLITSVIHRPTLHFAVARNIVHKSKGTGQNYYTRRGPTLG